MAKVDYNFDKRVLRSSVYLFNIKTWVAVHDRVEVTVSADTYTSARWRR